MSNLHTTADVLDQQTSAFFIAAIEVTAAVQLTIRALAMGVFAAIQRPFMQRRLTRLSDYMLRDLGFERDWDGSIRSLREID